MLSLDQEKAFDRVDHEFLFKMLKSYGFGDVFISYITLLYSNVHVMVKVGGGLSAPIPVTRGISNCVTVIFVMKLTVLLPILPGHSCERDF